MKIPYLFSITNEMPIRIRRYKLDIIKASEFNSGEYKDINGRKVEFARHNYKYLFELDIDKGPGKTYVKLATPSFRQILYSIRVLWNAKEGDPYDRHNHPVVLQAFDVREMPMESTMKDEKTRKKVVKDFRKSYAKNKDK